MDMQPGAAIGGHATQATKPKNVITPEFRVSFAYVFRPQKAMNPGQEPKYSVTMLFPKGADLSRLMQAVKDCIVEEFGSDKNTWPKLRNPFRDQGEKDFEGYEKGAVFITATSKQKPGLVDHMVQPIINESEFYSGCYAIASVRPFYYETNGNKGISFGLQNIQKTRDGEPLAGRSKPEDDFTPIAPEHVGGGDSLTAAQIFG